MSCCESEIDAGEGLASPAQEKLLLKGDIRFALALLLAGQSMMLGLATNPIPVKTAMRLLGRDNGQLRMPMTPLDATSEARLRGTLSSYGLL